MADTKKNVKDTASTVGKTILDYIDKGVEASKRGLKTASSAISDFGDRSVLRIELSQLRGKRVRALADLGAIAYRLLSGPEALITAENEEVKACLETLAKLDEGIAQHERALAESMREQAKAPAGTPAPEGGAGTEPEEPAAGTASE